MKKLMLALTLTATAAAFSVGCGGDTTPGTTGTKECASNSDCTSGKEICHPVGKVCLPTCNAGSDCPQNQKNCAPVKDAAGKESAEKVCQCQTPQLCKGSDSASKLTCSDVDNICETGCSTDSDCAGFKNTVRKCDSGKGVCVIASEKTCTANSDCSGATPKCDAAGTKKCVACLANSDCTTGTATVCNASHACAVPTAKTCSTSNAQPDVCSYGEYCNASSVCVTASSTNTCGAATSYSPSSDAAHSPVIWGVAQTGTTRTATIGPCANIANGITEFQGKWYDPDSDVTATGSYQKITYVTVAGVNPGTGGNTYEKTSITVDTGGKSGTFKFELCQDLKGKAGGVTIFDNASHESNVACYTF